MSFGDEHSEPLATVTPIRPRKPWEAQPRPCAGIGCHGDTIDPGELCARCRVTQQPVSAAFLQSTIADAIRRFERLRPRDTPEPARLAIAQALSDMRRAYDLSETLIQEESE